MLDDGYLMPTWRYKWKSKTKYKTGSFCVCIQNDLFDLDHWHLFIKHSFICDVLSP